MRDLKERVEAWSRVIDSIQDETSQNYSTPQDLMKIVRRSMPNLVRGKVFSEFAMEASQNDIIHYSRTPLPELLGDGHYRVKEEKENAKEEFNQIWDIVNTLKM